MYWKGFNEQQREKPGYEDVISDHADWVYDGGYDLHKHGHRISDKSYIWERFYALDIPNKMKNAVIRME